MFRVIGTVLMVGAAIIKIFFEGKESDDGRK